MTEAIAGSFALFPRLESAAGRKRRGPGETGPIVDPVAVSALPRCVGRSVGSTPRFGRDCWPQGQPQLHTLLRKRVKNAAAENDATAGHSRQPPLSRAQRARRSSPRSRSQRTTSGSAGRGWRSTAKPAVCRRSIEAPLAIELDDTQSSAPAPSSCPPPWRSERAGPRSPAQLERGAVARSPLNLRALQAAPLRRLGARARCS